MDMFLEVIKARGKAIIVQGPEGSGKTMLAKCLAEGLQSSCTTIEKVLSGVFTEWLGSHPAVVIVEGFADNANDIAQLSMMVARVWMSCKLLRKNPIEVNTPLFIFCTSEPVEIPRGCRRFYTITLDPGAAW